MARAKRTTSRRRTTKRTKSTYSRRGHRTARRRTRAQYSIPSTFACDGQRGPATSVMTTNAAYPMVGMNGVGIRVPTNSMVGMNGAGIRRITNAPYGTASYNPYGPGGPSMRTANAVYGFNNQVVDDNKSSGLALGPQPFRMR